MPERWQDAVGRLVATMHGHAPADHAWRLPLEEWCREAGAEVLVRADDDLDALGRSEAGCPVIGLPGTLEVARDPDMLVRALAAAGAQLHVAVTWHPTSPVAARRGFHPASLIGVLEAHYAVTDIAAEDGMITAAARPEADAGERRCCNVAALLGLQDTIEAALDQAMMTASQVDGYAAGVASLGHAVIEADDAHFVTRRQRNDARAVLREERERTQVEIATLKARLADLHVEIEGARAGEAALRQRLERMERSRWWQIGRVLADARQRPRHAWDLPARLWRAGRRTG